jgi:beta-N-acetylhexosaminidase
MPNLSEKKILKIITNFFFSLIFLITLVFIFLAGTLFLASIRDFVLVFSLIAGFICFLIARKFKSKMYKIYSLIVLVFAFFSIFSFQFNKFMFFNFQENSLETNKHLIIGYRSESEIRKLVRQNKIAGVYVTKRNVEGKTKDEIKNFLSELQNERKKHSSQELIIMADQEGGIVSHLSPLLTQTGTLAKVLAEDKNSFESKIQKIASIHGSELAEIGINVNLAPVADLENENSAEGFSQISKRAISKNPEEIQIVVKNYCNKLWEYGIKCTLKHFPGIGDVAEDTHFRLGIKKGDLEKIKYEASSFRSPQNPHFVMVSHTKIEAIDNQNPASTSRKSIEFLKQINPDAKVITDDFSMMPISKGVGIKKAYTASLEAGVDYILISYDKDLGYELW